MTARTDDGRNAIACTGDAQTSLAAAALALEVYEDHLRKTTAVFCKIKATSSYVVHNGLFYRKWRNYYRRRIPRQNRESSLVEAALSGPLCQVSELSQDKTKRLSLAIETVCLAYCCYHKLYAWWGLLVHGVHNTRTLLFRQIAILRTMINIDARSTSLVKTRTVMRN